jgi:hypothetical protein
VKVKKWLGDNVRMSVFDIWPPASGDLKPMDDVFANMASST